MKFSMALSPYAVPYLFAYPCAPCPYDGSLLLACPRPATKPISTNSEGSIKDRPTTLNFWPLLSGGILSASSTVKKFGMGQKMRSFEVPVCCSCWTFFWSLAGAAGCGLSGKDLLVTPDGVVARGADREG